MDINLNNIAKASDLTSEITARQNADNLKVDKIVGKGLSTEDYTTAEKGAINAAWVDFFGSVVITGIDTITVNKYNYRLDPISRICEIETQIEGKLILTNTSPTITLPQPLSASSAAIYQLTAIKNNGGYTLGWGITQPNSNVMAFFNGVGFGFFTTTNSNCGLFMRMRYRY